MRIAVDVMGGDHGPDVVIDGVKLALDEFIRSPQLYLVGNEAEIRRADQSRLSDQRIEILHASEVLTMEDKPVEGLRKKKDCSILRASRAGQGRQRRCDYFSSATPAALSPPPPFDLGRIAGVDRPAIATVMPTRKQ